MKSGKASKVDFLKTFKSNTGEKPKSELPPSSADTMNNLWCTNMGSKETTV